MTGLDNLAGFEHNKAAKIRSFVKTILSRMGITHPRNYAIAPSAKDGAIYVMLLLQSDEYAHG